MIGKKAADSPSIHPADPDSRYYSPEVLRQPRRSRTRIAPTNDADGDDADNGGHESGPSPSSPGGP